MTYTLYDGFVLQSKRALLALSEIVKKAEAHPNASTFPSARLFENMKSFSYQIMAATTQTHLVLSRLTEVEPPVFDSNNDIVISYDEMHAVIGKAINALEGVDKVYLVQHCEEVKPTDLGGQKLALSGVTYASIMQANIFFHVTTAYGILRKEGVPLGKVDYLLPFIQLGIS